MMVWSDGEVQKRKRHRRTCRRVLMSESGVGGRCMRSGFERSSVNCLGLAGLSGGEEFGTDTIGVIVEVFE